MIFLLFFTLCVCFSGVVFLLLKDRDDWRARYDKLVVEHNVHAEHFLNATLVKNGVRPVSIPYEPTIKAGKQSVPPVLESRVDEDERLIFEDRVRERMEVGIISEEDGERLIDEIRAGDVSATELDLQIWKFQRDNLTGSVLEN